MDPCARRLGRSETGGTLAPAAATRAAHPRHLPAGRLCVLAGLFGAFAAFEIHYAGMVFESVVVINTVIASSSQRLERRLFPRSVVGMQLLHHDK
jgi:hypothetical protein